MIGSILCLVLGAPAPQQLPPGIPHPAHVLREELLREIGEDGGYLDEDVRRGMWVSLLPRWVASTESPIGAAAHQALSEFVAARNGWREANREAWLAATRFAPVQLRYSLVDLESGQALFAGSEDVAPGIAKCFSDYRARQVVKDFDVEIAQSASIADPVSGWQFAGVSLAIQLLPVPGIGYQAELALVASDFGEDAAIDTGYHAIQGKDRLQENLAEFGATAILTPGRAASFAVPGQYGRYRLDLSLAGPLPEATFPAGNSIVCLAVPSLSVREDWPEEVARLELVGDTWSDGGGFVAFAGETGPEQAALLLERMAARAQSYAYTLKVSIHSEGEDQVLCELQGETVVGQPVLFAQGSLAQALTDWDVEVAQASRIADPVFETLFDGARGSLSIGSSGQVELDLTISDVRHGNASLLTVSGVHPAVGEGDSGGSLVPDRVKVERPEAAQVRIRGGFQPDAQGRVVVERYSQQLLSEPSTLRVELQVKAVQ